jgi:ribosome-binding factor A
MEGKRQAQVGELIKRNFSAVLQEEGRYIYGNVLVSVTNVKMSPDLLLAKIYLSIYGAENKDEVIISIEQSLFKLKNSLAHRIRKQVRRMPEIDVYIDETLDEMYRIDALFKNIKPPSTQNEEE